MLLISHLHDIVAHTCTFPGCGHVLILDGNMKNRRDVCYAKDAGFIEFEGLVGSIKTGCPATPSYMSRFCADHKNQACILSVNDDTDEELGEVPGPVVRSRQRKCRQGEPIAGSILAKKMTRKQTYYQVL